MQATVSGRPRLARQALPARRHAGRAGRYRGQRTEFRGIASSVAGSDDVAPVRRHRRGDADRTAGQRRRRLARVGPGVGPGQGRRRLPALPDPGSPPGACGAIRPSCCSTRRTSRPSADRSLIGACATRPGRNDPARPSPPGLRRGMCRGACPRTLAVRLAGREPEPGTAHPGWRWTRSTSRASPCAPPGTSPRSLGVYVDAAGRPGRHRAPALTWAMSPPSNYSPGAPERARAVPLPGGSRTTGATTPSAADAYGRPRPPCGWAARAVRSAEFKSMVDALHRAGLEAALDGGVQRHRRGRPGPPAPLLRGIDNTALTTPD